jgi:hypothetical protein
MSVTLMTQTWFSGVPKFALPEIPGVLILKVEDRPLQGVETIGGVSYTYQRHEFAMFAQRAGSFVILPFEVQFASAGKPGGEPIGHKMKTQRLRVTVKTPPGAEELPNLISTPLLKVRETWDPEPENARVGDAFTRRITRQAPDVPGMAFPPLEFMEEDGLGVYPKDPEVRDSMERGDFTGERVESVIYVCERSGPVTIPGIAIPWWDVEGRELRKVELPAVMLDVAPNPSLERQTGSLPPVKAATQSISRWLAGLVFLTLSICIAVLWVTRRPVSARWKAWQARRRESEKAYFRNFRRACRSGDATATFRALMVWLDRSDLGGRDGTLACFLHLADDPELDKQVHELQNTLYAVRRQAGDKQALAGGKLYMAVRKSRLRLRRASPLYSNRHQELPALNP